jgi:hypothetical protein
MVESDRHDDGPKKAARRGILMFGEERLGPATEAIRQQLQAITDLARLERMVKATLTVASWRDVLKTR